MPNSADARIPVLLDPAGPPGPATALLLEGAQPAPEGVATVAWFDLPKLVHLAGCACCLPRGPVAQALGALFQARARGQVPFFTAVHAHAASPAGRQAILEALDQDVLLAARYRTA